MLGLGLAQLLRLLFRTFGAELPGGDLVVAPRTVAVAYAVGVGVTLVSAWFPARRASTVAPVAALRDDGPPPPRSLHVRGAVGLVLLALAVGLAVWGLRQTEDAERAAQLVGGSALFGLVAAIVLSRSWPGRRCGRWGPRSGRRPVGWPGRTPGAARVGRPRPRAP